VDMTHHFKHKDVNETMGIEIKSLMSRSLPWCNIRLIDIADKFLSPAQRNTMIQCWARPNGPLMESEGAHQWTVTSKAPLPLQHTNWMEDVGTPLNQTFESRLGIFFNEVFNCGTSTKTFLLIFRSQF
jgi:hypothetical protein